MQLSVQKVSGSIDDWNINLACIAIKIRLELCRAHSLRAASAFCYLHRHESCGTTSIVDDPYLTLCEKLEAESVRGAVNRRGK